MTKTNGVDGSYVSYTRKVDGKEQKILEKNGQFFIFGSNNQLVEVKKTRNGNMFHKAEFETVKDNHEITMEPKNIEFDDSGNPLNGPQKQKDGQYIFYKDGKIVGYGPNKDKYSESIGDNKIKTTYYDSEMSLVSEYDPETNLMTRRIGYNKDNKKFREEIFENGLPVKHISYKDDEKTVNFYITLEFYPGTNHPKLITTFSGNNEEEAKAFYKEDGETIDYRLEKEGDTWVKYDADDNKIEE